MKEASYTSSMDTNMKQHYAVTGGAGFIGTNLVERLIADGHAVTVIDDLSAGKRERLPKEAHFLQLDVRATEDLVDAMRGADAIFHLAALPRVQYSIEHPQETFDVNVTGTLSVLEAARRAGVHKVIFASTCAVYGESEQLPLTESLPLAPKSPYALHKQMGEGLMHLYHTLYGLETASLRFFNVYGPHLDPDGPYALVIGQFLKRFAHDEPIVIFGDGEQTRDFVHVHDVVDALVRASQLDSSSDGVYNIGSGVETSIRSLAGMFSDNIQHEPPRIEPRRTCADIGHVRDVLGWEPHISLEGGIEELKREFSAGMA